MAGLLAKIMGGDGGSSFSAPPGGREEVFSAVSDADGADLFRLMSKANKYSSCSSGRKQKKAGEYAYMAGKMMHDQGITDPAYSAYHQAYSEGNNYGCAPEMVDDFRSGRRTENRRNRRQQHGRYESRPQTHNEGKGKGCKKEEGGMFDWFDSDTSSSSEEE